MCEASVHVPHREAKAEERLEVRALPGCFGMVGLYPQAGMPLSYKLVCIRQPTQGWIEQVQIIDEPRGFRAPPWAKKYDGQTNVPVQVNTTGHRDFVVFPNGRAMMLMNLAVGTKINVGIPLPVTGEPGVEAVKAALVEHDKTQVGNEGPVRRALSMTANAIRKRAARAKAKV